MNQEQLDSLPGLTRIAALKLLIQMMERAVTETKGDDEK